MYIQILINNIVIKLWYYLRQTNKGHFGLYWLHCI